MKIFNRPLFARRRVVVPKETDILLEQGFALERDAEEKEVWSRQMLDGFLQISNDQEVTEASAEEDSWRCLRQHYNGGRIEVGGLTLDAALRLKIPSPIHQDGSPIYIRTEDPLEMDVLWFIASRAPTGNSPDEPSAGDSTLISLTAARMKRRGRTPLKAAGEGGTIIAFPGTGAADPLSSR